MMNINIIQKRYENKQQFTSNGIHNIIISNLFRRFFVP